MDRRRANTAKRGQFIVLEGTDGCGKSTQIRLLAERLKGLGRDVETVRDPGSTPIGEAIRAVLLNPEFAEMSVRTEMMLYMASRAQLVAERIEPALAAGRVIVSDRFVTSTLVYQGFAGGLDVAEINRLHEYACGGTRPDLVVVVDIPVEVSRTRLGRGLDRMEAKSGAFHEKVRQGYLKVGEGAATKHVVIDGSGPVETVAETIWKAVSHVL